MNTRSIGSRYESAACGYLIDKGYKILERNYKNKLGEIAVSYTHLTLPTN